MSAKTENTAILLLAHGTPDSIEQIPKYLRNVTSGRTLPKSAIEEIKHRYGLIGHSPLTEITFEQAHLLGEKLAMPVYVGMRNWKPYIATTVRQMLDAGVTAAAVICLAPQNSRTSVGLYRRAVLAETGKQIAIDFTDGWAEHPLLADAFAEKLRTAWIKVSEQTGEKVPILFTAHSVPCRTVQSAPSGSTEATLTAAPTRTGPPQVSADPYAIEAKRTAALVAERMQSAGLTARDWFFAFQSQGMSGGPWIGPTVEESLKALREAGHTAVMIQPIGFLCDHVEILYDIDIGFREYGRSIGLEIARPESLNGASLLIDALADLAREGLKRLEERRNESLTEAKMTQPASA